MLILMICYARSGGTILNKCLASLENTIVMSEVNPIGGGWGAAGSCSYTTVYEQALHWYGIKLSKRDFKGSIIELNKYCEDNGKDLVIRDWSYVNFAKTKYNEFKPPNKLLTVEIVKELNPKIFILLRDVIDVWISRNMPNLNDFCNEYQSYINALTGLNAPIFKYEDLAREPRKVFKEICNFVGLKYQDVISKCVYYDKVNGDTQSDSRGAKQRKIKPLKRRAIPLNMISEVNKSEIIFNINKLFNYSSNYFGNISIINYIIKRISILLFILLKKILKKKFKREY